MQPFTFAFVFSLFPFNAWNSSQSETHVGHFHSLAEVAAAGGRQSRVKLLWQICFCSRGGGGGRGQWELAGKTGRPISGEHCEFPKAKGHSRPILRNHSQSRCLEDFRIFMEIQRKILFFFPPFQVSRQRWKSNRMFTRAIVWTQSTVSPIGHSIRGNSTDGSVDSLKNLLACFRPV